MVGLADWYMPVILGWAEHHYGYTRSIHPTTMDVLAGGGPRTQTWHPWTRWAGSIRCVPLVCAHHMLVVAGHKPQHVGSSWWYWSPLQWHVEHQDWNHVLICLNERDVGNWLPIPHMPALKTHWPNWNAVLCGKFLVPMARRAGTDWTEHKVVRGREALDNRWCTANHKSDNRLWTDALCNNDWQPGKQPQMMVFRCQRCCTQLKTDMEHVLNHTHFIRRTTWKHMTHTAQFRSDVATRPHEWPWTQELNSPPTLDAHAAIAHPGGSIPHVSLSEAMVRATIVCAGNAPKPRTRPWRLVVNVEEVDCGCESSACSGQLR